MLLCVSKSKLISKVDQYVYVSKYFANSQTGSVYGEYMFNLYSIFTNE